MSTLSHGLSWIDLQFRGRPNVIATGLVQGAAGVALIDPGPASCLAMLEDGLQRHGVRWPDVRHILLTHIHLDHAGATGTIVRAHPHVRVLVHERGAGHMADPTRLLDSARRIYADRMDALWGEVASVPADVLTVLTGGERVDVAGRVFEVAYTPGHASHHVSYFDASSGVAFVGDVAGVRIDGGYVLPPTPPPDIDLEAWAASVERILAWSPGTLFLTHFGPSTDVRAHLAALLDNLQMTAGMVRASLDDDRTDEERRAAFADAVRQELRRHMTDERMAGYVVAAAFEHLWNGLARYWRKKG
jgi:glyoxylase-like metal-dependent hydrolase (beta-lactamase superfamily II)